MAYFIFDSNNNLVNIAMNDADKDSLNRDLTTLNVETVTDSDANQVIWGESEVTYDGNTVTVTPIDFSVRPDIPEGCNPTTTEIFVDSDQLQNYITKCVIPEFKNFCINNPDNSMWPTANTYWLYLQDLDYSTVTYPINYSWEKYCNDNGITYLHPLQLP